MMQTHRQAWQIDRQLRLNAIPVDRRRYPSHWDEVITFPHGDALIALFWNASVPGSGAPEIPYVEMVQSMANRGYDVSSAEALLDEGMLLAEKGDAAELRRLTARLLAELFNAQRIPGHIYWSYEHPSHWDDVVSSMPAPVEYIGYAKIADLQERIYQGWLGQLAGGAFGTCIEGYHTSQIEKVYGEISSYLVEPETMNDDVVYELVFLDVFEQKGQELTSIDLALEWVRQIPFGWSAEWVALENLHRGILPPQSGSFRNPYSDFIGAQMRGMVCGMLAPAQPLEAARLAHLDAVISHAANGVYGEIFSAVLISLAFNHADTRSLIHEAQNFLPRRSEYATTLSACLDTLRDSPDYRGAWKVLDQHFEEYNWIHAYPNLAADLLALWYGNADFTNSFQILAHAGMDVDCNAGLVGNILGIMHGVPESWSAPLGDLLETYLPGKERLSIRQLSERTARLAQIHFDPDRHRH
jgi:ADP-ribosylglycohydrolase